MAYGLLLRWPDFTSVKYFSKISILSIFGSKICIKELKQLDELNL